MKQAVFSGLIACLFSIIGCQERSANTKENESNETGNQDSKPADSSWLEFILPYYIEHANNELVKINVNEEEWLFDQAIETDSTIYLIFQIGHTVREEGGTSPRFITDMRLYLDTVRQKAFEYDLQNDSLIEWVK